MDEPRRPRDGDDEEEVRRLLAAAGPRPEVPEDDLAAITAAARAAWLEAVHARRRGEAAEERRWTARRPALAAAAVLAAALGLGAWWWLARTAVPAELARVETVRGSAWLQPAGVAERPLAAGDAVPAGAAVRTAPGAALSLRLPGGTDLRLDADTLLHFPPFADLVSAGARNDDPPLTLALARGALYADTGDDRASTTSLRIHTPVATAEDVGTRFAVRLLDAPRPALEVRVRAGAVAVERGGARWLAPAGEELVVAAEGEPLRRAVPAFGAGWEWVAGAAAFDVEGRTVAELLAWVARETGWTLRWQDAGVERAAREIVLHGDFGDLPPERAAFVVLPGADLEARLEDGELVVSRR